MSPELETLDQLLGGDMPAAVVRTLYPDDDRFLQGIKGLLAGGDVRLMENGIEVPSWRWAKALTGDLAPLWVSLTDAGAKQIT